MRTFKKNILDLIETSISTLCQRMIDMAQREQCTATFEPDGLVFETLDDQSNSYVEEFDCATRIITINDPYSGQFTITFEELRLELQLELIDQLEDDLEFVV